MRGNLLRSLCFPACSPRRSPLTWHALMKLHVGPRQCADEVLRDLPRVADVRIAQRLLTTAEPGRLTETEQLAGPRGVTGNLTDPKPSTSRLRSPVLAVSSTLNAVCASPAQRPGQPVTRRPRHGVPPEPPEAAISSSETVVNRRMREARFLDCGLFDQLVQFFLAQFQHQWKHRRQAASSRPLDRWI